ncbi:MAG TPA: hypothetical protein PL110_05085 [Candidatus Eremiobacteraeota bacterium]|nr:MAG: hypothetical protein BWY64_00665 [bacterium ADurb.Bin363]HPZ07465.1 hypothetical protein [Candidatus Eremiobacteraeota bacterium]
MIGFYKFPEIRSKLLNYYRSVCRRCNGRCCTYNTSPVSCKVPLELILNSEDIIILKKALFFDITFKNKFKENIRTGLLYLIKKGFALDFLDYLEENDFNVKSFVTVYRGIDARINEFNEKMAAEGRYEAKHDECFCLIPGRGCIFEHYRPLVCKMAFRYCFKELDLYEFLEGNIRVSTGEEVLKYLEDDIKLNERVMVPKIVLGADTKVKSSAMKFLKEDMKSLEFDTLSYMDMVKLADFLISPFITGDLEIGNTILSSKLPGIYPLIFIDNLFRDDRNEKFGFGLECVEVFMVGEK